MHGMLPRAAAPATSSSPGNGIDPVPDAGANPGSGTGDDWFVAVALAVFGKKEAGLHLHLATGWPRTSCYAYVARDPDQRRKVPTEFLHILFASEQGEPFFVAFMERCKARWWIERQRERRVGAAAIAAMGE